MQYKPIEGGELTQIQFMHSLYRLMKDDDSLKDRLNSIRKGQWWRYCGLRSQLRSMFADIWNTIDPVTRQRVNMVWSNQELRIVNSNQAVDPTGDLIMVPKSAVMYMAKDLQKGKCAMCFGGHSDKKDCLFRRAMLDLSIPDLRREEKRSGKCVGHIFDWGKC